jgi:hypothetical protein
MTGKGGVRLFRGWHHGFGARDGRVFLDVAGGGPFGKFRGVVFVGVLDDGFQDVEGDGGLMRGIGQAAGGVGLGAEGVAFVADDGFKGGDVRRELGDEGGGEAGADERGGKGGGIGGKGAGGVEQGLVAVAVGHEEFAGEGVVAQQHEGMGGVGDGDHVIVQMKAAGGFAEDGAVDLFGAGDLAGAEVGRGGHGEVDEGELLSAEAGGRVIRGIFDAEGVHGLEGSDEAADLLFHNVI